MMQQLLESVASNVVLSAALALFTFGLTRAWRSPQLAHALWLLVLFKLVSPPLVSVPIPGAKPHRERALPVAPADHPDEERNQEIASSTAEQKMPRPALAPLDQQHHPLPSQATMDTLPTTPGPEPIVESPPGRLLPNAKWLAVRWPWGLCFVWGAGVFVGVTILVRRIGRFRALLARASEADSSLVDETRELANRLGLRRCPSIRILDAHLPPLVCAAWRGPLLVLPETLLHTLDREQIQSVLVHELAHLRRGDHLVRWFEIGVCGLLWWNPLAWWAARQLRRAEEECCDAWVVWALPHARQSYGRALLQTVDFLLEHRAVPAVARTAFGGPHIKRRIEMIVKRKLNQKMSAAALLTVIVSAVCVLPVSAQKKIDAATAEQAATEAEGIAAEREVAEAVAAEAAALEQEAAVAELNAELATAVQALVTHVEPPGANRDLESRIERLEKALQELTQAIKARPPETNGGKPGNTKREDVNSVPRRVLINAGETDRMPPHTTFSVYRKKISDDGGDSARGQTGRGDIKGTIEVIRIIGPHQAEARILNEDLQNPIAKGDPIDSPLLTSAIGKGYSIVRIISPDADGSTTIDVGKPGYRLEASDIFVEPRSENPFARGEGPRKSDRDPPGLPQAEASSSTANSAVTPPADDDEYTTREVTVVRMQPIQEIRTVRVRKADVQKQEDAKAKKHLLSLNDELWDAAEKRDPSVAERLQADDYIGMWVNASGSGTNNKAADIAAVQRRKYSEVSRRDADVRRISDDVAILTYVYDCKVQEGDRIEIYRGHQATQLWARTKDGRWLLHFTQDFVRPGGQ